jgi:hypothetical protein
VAQEFEDGLRLYKVESTRMSSRRFVDDLPHVFYEVDLIKIAGLPLYLSRLTPFAWQRMPDGGLSHTIPRPRVSAPDAN